MKNLELIRKRSFIFGALPIFQIYGQDENGETAHKTDSRHKSEEKIVQYECAIKQRDPARQCPNGISAYVRTRLFVKIDIFDRRPIADRAYNSDTGIGGGQDLQKYFFHVIIIN